MAVPLSLTVPFRVAPTAPTPVAALAVAVGDMPRVTVGDAASAVRVPMALDFWVVLRVLTPAVDARVAPDQVMVAVAPLARVTPVTWMMPLLFIAAVPDVVVTLPSVPSDETLMSISPLLTPPVAAV